MEIEYEDATLSKLESDVSYDAGLDRAIVRAFRMRVQMIRAAADERAFYALTSLHFEKLRGKRVGQYSMRLNDQWRLIIKFRDQNNENGKVVVVISISDYH